MKKKLFRYGRMAVLLLLVLLLTAHLFRFNNISNGVRIRGFYREPKNSLDIVFVGASEIYTGTLPGRLWKEQGITSYLYASSSAPISLVRWELEEIRRTQDPQLIVIEINGAVVGYEDYQTSTANLRKCLDYMPLSENKIRAIRALVPAEEQSSFFFPFLKYHANWKYPRRCLENLYLQTRLNLAGSRLKGCQTTTKIASRRKLRNIREDTSTKELTESGESALRDLLEYCRSEKIDNLLFVRYPHQIQGKLYDDFRRANRAGEIIREYEYDFVNFEYQKQEIGLKMNHDFYNQGHMNIYGAEKFTSYMGEYLREHYGLHDLPHSQEISDSWDQTAENTDDFIGRAKELCRNGVSVKIHENWDVSHES